MPAATKKRPRPAGPPAPEEEADSPPSATTHHHGRSGGGGDGWSEGNTRICVKNVPKHMTEARLREHFAQHGQVTDARLVKTKTGQSRRMAFVGFKEEEEARAAVTFFHNTFLDTSKLQVEEAKPRGDGNLARPWSKYSEGSSRFEKEMDKKGREGKGGEWKERGVKRSKADEEEEEEDGRPEKKKKEKARRIGKEEFLAAMMPRSAARSWANDEAEIPVAMEQGESDDDEEEEDGDDEEEGGDQRLHQAGGDDDDDEEDEEDEEAPAAAVSDLDYLKSKVNKKLEEQVDVDGGEEEEEEGEESSSPPPSRAKASKKGEEEGAPLKKPRVEEEEEEEGPETDNSRLFVRNLPFSATEDDLREAFLGFGEVVEVHHPLDEAKRPKGFGFVQFMMPEDAKKAQESMDGRAFQGRLLHVTVARPLPKDPLAALDPSKARTYKERKEIERRQRAGDTKGWNASYIRSETVVDALADRLSVEKGSIMDREAGDMAVRLAVGETLLLAENREVFEKEGVDLSVLEGAQKKQLARGAASTVKRSTTTILVKNLPFSTTSEELTKLFGRFGALARVVLPASKTLALVDYVEPSEARKAFKGLAYKKFQHVPLYLEWAPLGTFVKSGKEVGEKKPVEGDVEVVVAPEEVEEEAEGVSTSLFIKNLNFSTTEEGLRAFVSRKAEGMRAVSIPRKRTGNGEASGKKGDKQGLSMGFGFVEFNTAASARAALRSLNGITLDGHKLECKTSNKRLSPEAPAQSLPKSKKKCKKLLVKNLAFQANAKEVSTLFGSFGKVKTLRMPKKFDGKHRGFAFVEFLTAQEAESAMKALSSTHLYGRHLVLEWAEDEEGEGEVEVRRKKVMEEEKKRKKKERVVREIVGSVQQGLGGGEEEEE